jgi:hypothetical protein
MVTVMGFGPDHAKRSSIDTCSRLVTVASSCGEAADARMLAWQVA